MPFANMRPPRGKKSKRRPDDLGPVPIPGLFMRNRYEVRGDHAVIFLARKDGSSAECLVDIEDLPVLAKYRWSTHICYANTLIYAVSRVSKPNGTRLQWSNISMHRLVTRDQNPNNRHIDHINHNTLDNRKVNLRPASSTLNGLNRSKLPMCSLRVNGRFSASIGYQGEVINLGTFDTEVEAQICHMGASKALQYVETQKQ